MPAALLALGASLAYGTSDFLAGVESRRRSVCVSPAVSQPTALLVAGVFVLLNWRSPGGLDSFLAPFLGGIEGGCAIVVYYLALSLGTMSVVAPIVSVCALVPVAVGLAEGERGGLVQYAGMALALGGIVLCSRAEARETAAVSVSAASSSPCSPPSASER